MAYDSPERRRTLQLQARAFEFAVAVLSQCPHSITHLASRELWRQLVRSASSVSLNLEEADEASSDADFIAKMKIALREAKESRRLILFVTRCKLANFRGVEALQDEARQLSSIFAAIILNKKKSMAAKKSAQRNSR